MSSWTSISEVEVRDYDELFVREFANVARHAFFVLNDRELALEVTQEAFIRLYQRWSKISRYDVPFAWVRKVAIRLALKNRMRRAREIVSDSLLEKSQETHPDANIDLHSAIAELPRTQRAAVVLYYLEDLGIADVARIIGCREGTVKTHLARARTHLARVLTDMESV